MLQTRRRFLTTLSLASATGLLSWPPASAAEGTLETTTVRLHKPQPSICTAPVLVADDMLRAEGFTDVRYVSLPLTTSRPEAVARGEIDFTMNFATAACHRDRPRHRDHRAGRCACRLFRIVRQRKHPQHCRSQGQDRRD